MMILNARALDAITYCTNGKEIYIYEGQLLRIEVRSLLLFRVHLDHEQAFCFERTELDFFLKRRIIEIVSRKRASLAEGFAGIRMQ